MDKVNNENDETLKIIAEVASGRPGEVEKWIKNLKKKHLS